MNQRDKPSDETPRLKAGRSGKAGTSATGPKRNRAIRFFEVLLFLFEGPDVPAGRFTRRRLLKLSASRCRFNDGPKGPRSSSSPDLSRRTGSPPGSFFVLQSARPDGCRTTNNRRRRSGSGCRRRADGRGRSPIHVGGVPTSFGKLPTPVGERLHAPEVRRHLLARRRRLLGCANGCRRGVVTCRRTRNW